jgi:HEAT repeat protein
VLALCAAAVPAQDTSASDTTAEELIAREELRQTVEDALALYQRDEENGAVKNHNFLQAVESVVAAGTDTVPLLAGELDQALPDSFFFCAYALGRLGTPEAEEALRRALERTRAEPGNYAHARQGWASYGLALMGVTDAVKLVYEGRHKAGHLPMQRGVTMIEAIALQLGAPAVPPLLELVDRAAVEEDLRGERIFVLRALWRIPNPAAVSKLLEVAAEEDFRMRREAVRALAFIRGPEALPAVWAALDDPEATVRQVAAAAIERSEAKVSLELLQKKLETETLPGVRAAYYRMLADRGGAAVVPFLLTQWGRPEAIDRKNLVRAAGSTRSKKAYPLLRGALGDQNRRVSTQAVAALAEMGDDQAIEQLFNCLHAQQWDIVQTAAEKITELNLPGGGAAITERLTRVELGGVMKDAGHRYRADMLARLLVRLRYVEALEPLREATERQLDPMLIRSMETAIDELELLKKLGRDRKEWAAVLGSPQRHLRSLAYERLGELGDEESARSLVRAFGRVAPDEGAEILRACRETNAEAAQALIERVLTEPAFDRAETASLRDEAAWSARSVGGERMRNALLRSAERTGGASAHVLVYLAVLDGKAALPLLERYRVPRMRNPSTLQGKQMEKLDWLARRIEEGRSTHLFDLPPETLRL